MQSYVERGHSSVPNCLYCVHSDDCRNTLSTGWPAGVFTNRASRCHDNGSNQAADDNRRLRALRSCLRMRVVRSDPRKRRSGQTRGLYFVVKSGDGAPRDNQGTLCSNFQADARDPSSWRRGLPDGRRELPTAAPPLSSGSSPRRPHTPDTPPARASVRDRPRPTQPARGRPSRRRGDQPHPPPRARVWVSPPAAADGGPARCGAPPLLAPATV